MYTCTTITGKQCEKLIKVDRYEYNDMMAKLDLFLIGDRIAVEDYKYLDGLMNEKLPKPDHSIV